MFVRFRQSHRRQKVYIVANTRREGRVVQEIIAYLGSIETAAMASDGTLQSIYARHIFWESAAPKLKDLDDRISPDDIGRLRLAIDARIPQPTKAERTQFAQHKADFRPRKTNGKPIAVRTRVVKRRRRRPDWKPRQPRRAEMLKWMQQFLGWTTPARDKAWLLIRDSKGRLPDDAYYSDDAAERPDGDRTVGTQKRNAKGAV